jgi:hypothetical protein
VVTVAPGKHRRPEPEMQAPAGTSFGPAGFLQAPVDVAGPAIANAAFPAGNGYPARTDPDWPPSEAAPWPQWDAPPPLLPPDHPSAPVPRVRAPLAPSRGAGGRGIGSNSAPGVPPPLPNSGRPRLPQRMPVAQSSSGMAARPGPRAYEPDAGQHPGPSAGLPARPAPRGSGRPQGLGPAARDNGRPLDFGRAPGNNGRPQGLGPAARDDGGPGGYDPGHHPVPAARPGPQPNGRPRGYGPGAANAAAQGYALARGYPPVPAHLPGQPQRPGRPDRRLYAVPDNATAADQAEAAPRTSLPARDTWAQTPGTMGFVRQPPFGYDGQASAIRQEALNEAAAIRQAAEQDAAAIRQAAQQDAAALWQESTAVREAAERDAANMRAVILSISQQLSEMSAYVTENLGSPGGAPTALAGAATAALVAAPPVPMPQAPAARPARPATRPARPATRPGTSTTRPATGTQGRQARAARKMVALLAAMVTVGVVSGAAELALHGGPFFIFRANGAGASETGPVENQGPGQPDAPGAHHVPAPPKHAK